MGRSDLRSKLIDILDHDDAVADRIMDAIDAAVEEAAPVGADNLSHTSVNGKRLTWAELVAYTEEKARPAHRLAAILTELDRCEHGRHEGDDCNGCGGSSKGNVMLRDGAPADARTVPRQIGHDIGARPIVIPGRYTIDDPDAWIAS